MKSAKPYSAFTQQFPALSNKLTSTAQVIGRDNPMDAIALWDTGATVTCISALLAKRLSLISTGGRTIRTPSGSKIVNTYLVDILLPNDILIQNVVVCDSAIGNQGFDVLIGMDIIGQGDLSVSNFKGKTVFTFRMPSQKVTDYAADAD